MAAIVESMEIARSPEDVFAYVDDLSRHGEWQEAIVSTQVETEGPLVSVPAPRTSGACPAGPVPSPMRSPSTIPHGGPRSAG